jgi:hypothetical protein
MLKFWLLGPLGDFLYKKLVKKISSFYREMTKRISIKSKINTVSICTVLRFFVEIAVLMRINLHFLGRNH